MAYGQDEIRDVKDLLDIQQRVPKEKRGILALMMTSFISGMEAQEAIDRSKEAEVDGKKQEAVV